MINHCTSLGPKALIKKCNITYNMTAQATLIEYFSSVDCHLQIIESIQLHLVQPSKRDISKKIG